MHKLWSYGSDKIVRQDASQVQVLCRKIQHEGNPQARRAYRSELHHFVDRLVREERRLARILNELETDWNLYPDEGELEAYYAHIERCYLIAGGHWAGKQQVNEVYVLTHRPGECPTCGQHECVCSGLKPLHKVNRVPLWHRAEAHAERGRNKLFKE